MDRQIVCFQIPAFEIALARLRDLSLRNRPVAIAPLHTPRACLREVSREAKDEGLQPGMPRDVARRLCPSLLLVPPDPVRVRQAHERLQAIVARYAPVWEPVRPGHLFLDLTGTNRLFGPAVETAVRMERELTRQHGLTGVAGVASNKLVSGVAAATLSQPPQWCDVKPGAERTFLAPVPIALVPGLSRAVARTTLARLNDLNLCTLGQIAEIPLAELEAALGRPARLLHRWACGIDPSPVLPPVQRPCLELSRRVEPDEVDDARLLGVLHELVEDLCRRLRRQHRICRRLTLGIQHNDHLEIAKSHAFKPGTCWEAAMSPALRELFFRCFTRRVRLRAMRISADVTEVSETPAEQLSLFDQEISQEDRMRIRSHRLATGLDRIRERFGARSIWWGRTHVLHENTSRSPEGRTTSCFPSFTCTSTPIIPRCEASRR